MERNTYEELKKIFTDLYQYERYEEKMYFLFEDEPNKIKVIKYVKREYLPTLKKSKV